MARTKDGWESREGASSCRGRPAPTSGPAELGETEEGLGPGLRLSLAERGTEAGRFPQPVATAGVGHSQEQRGAQAVLAEQAAVAVVAAGGEVLEDAVAADPHGQLAGGAVQRLHHRRRRLVLPAAPFQEVPLHRQLRELGRVVVQRLLLPTHGGGGPRPEPEPEGARPLPPRPRCLAAGRSGGGNRPLWRGTGPAPGPTPGEGTNGLPGQRGELSSARPPQLLYGRALAPLPSEGRGSGEASPVEAGAGGRAQRDPEKSDREPRQEPRYSLATRTGGKRGEKGPLSLLAAPLLLPRQKCTGVHGNCFLAPLRSGAHEEKNSRESPEQSPRGIPQRFSTPANLALCCRLYRSSHSKVS